MSAPPVPFIHRGVTSQKLKTAVFVLEGLNALSTTYFFYDIYFYTKAQFHFGAIHNLILAATMGVLYAVCALLAGRFAQRAGYFTSVRLGSAMMAVLFLIGSQVNGLAGTLAIIALGNMSLSLTWPALEALMSEGEPPARLQGLVGIYNVIWAGVGAIAYFAGGLMLQDWGLKSIFYVPAAILVVQTGFAWWLEREAEKQPPAKPEPRLVVPVADSDTSPISPALFLRMAWLANPLAYLAINTVIPTIPSLAAHFQFSAREAGFICSVWLFVRAGAFIFLRLWPKWHYRFRYLAGAYVGMIVSFGALLLAQNVWVLVLAQIIFGLALGLIYYSSLFYSMDVGQTKGEHGGIHEAAIGMGNAAGPGLAAIALAFFPDHPGSGTEAVCVLLLFGLAVLYWMRYRGSLKAARPTGFSV